MMALRAHARGGPEQLVYEEAPVPEAGPGEALVEVHAAAITFAELTWDQTWTTLRRPGPHADIPSHEVSGTVVGLGPGAGGVAVDDEVYGLIDFDRDGAAAQYVTLPAADLAARPRSVSHVETATLPLAALTAWQALVDHAALKPGERVLVTGGAGGVGSYVVQLAGSLGGSVTATGRAGPAGIRPRPRRWRVPAIPDGAGPTAASQEDGFDVVIDTVGGAVLDASYGLTRRGGRLVTLAAPPDADKAAALGVQATFFVVAPDATELAHLAELVDDGKLRPVLSQTFPLRDGREAFESATVPHPPGKTVLIVRVMTSRSYGTAFPERLN